MQAVIFEPLRWQDAPTRVSISTANEQLRVLYQVTAPQQIAHMVIGRPVEEIPRIAAIMGPAHHLVAARALDRFFGVTPPPAAENMRRALLQALILASHLQKVYFLICSQCDVFADFRGSAAFRGKSAAMHGLLDDTMHIIALSQEAAAILGGRNAHPITAIAGGVSRFLKEEECRRLAEIADACLPAVIRLVDTARDTLIDGNGGVADSCHIVFKPMAHMALSTTTAERTRETVRLQAPDGKTIDIFDVTQMGKKIGLQHEEWTHAPFTYIAEKGWQGVHSENTDGLYFVGPLARLNNGGAMETALAEKERERMIAMHGPFPRFDVVAAFGCLLVEILQAAEIMQDLYAEDNFIGPSFRKVPEKMGLEGQAALESPQGTLYHHFRATPEGLVNAFDCLDTAAENNALRCLLSQKTVENAREQNLNWKKTKARLELSLLPF